MLESVRNASVQGRRDEGRKTNIRQILKGKRIGGSVLVRRGPGADRTYFK